MPTGLPTLTPADFASDQDVRWSPQLPFVCLGMVLGYAVLRTGALFPAAVVHALLNLATIAAFNGSISLPLRTALSATVLVALVLGTVVAGRRLGIYRRMPVGRVVSAAT